MQELASSDSDETVLMDPRDAGGKEMEAGDKLGKEPIRRQVLLPKAFDTPIATAEAGKLAKSVGAKCSLPAALWNASFGREEPEKKKAVSTKRATEGRKARSEERLVQPKVCKKGAKTRAVSVARLKGGRKEHAGEEVERRKNHGMEVENCSGGSRGRSLVRPSSGRSASRSPRLDGTRVSLPNASVALVAAGGQLAMQSRGHRPRSVSRISAGSRGRRGGVVRAQSLETEISGKREDGKRRKRGWGPTDELEAQCLDHCLACGDGPMQRSLLVARCDCGGQLCRDCAGANTCMRCNGTTKAMARQQLLC